MIYLQWDTPEEAWQSALALTDGYTAAEYNQFLAEEESEISNLFSSACDIQGDEPLYRLRDRFEKRIDLLQNLLVQLGEDGTVAHQPRAARNLFDELERCRKVKADVDSFYASQKAYEEKGKSAILSLVNGLVHQMGQDPSIERDVGKTERYISQSPPEDAHTSSAKQASSLESGDSVGVPESQSNTTYRLSKGLNSDDSIISAISLSNDDLEQEKITATRLSALYNKAVTTIYRYTYSAIRQAGRELDEWKRNPGCPIELTKIEPVNISRVAVVEYVYGAQPVGWRYRFIKDRSDLQPPV